MSKKPEPFYKWEKIKNNPELLRPIFIKENIIRAVRRFFEQKNYHELDCPILSTELPSERYVEVLDTDVNIGNGKKQKLFLIPSTETFNKRALAAGLGNHLVISKVFRDLDGAGPTHSPEFSMLEWYTLDSNYLDIAKEAEDLIMFIKRFLEKKMDYLKGDFLNFSGTKINLKSPWEKFTVRDLLKNYLKIELEEILELEELKRLAVTLGYSVENVNDWQELFEQIFADKIEPNLPQDKPYFIYDYPKLLSPLAKQNDNDPEVCEKCELFIAGMEIANGYTELRDWKKLEANLKEEFEARKKLGKKDIPFDNTLIDAVRSGIPKVAGIGMGIDRLAMVFSDITNITDLSFFIRN